MKKRTIIAIAIVATIGLMMRSEVTIKNEPIEKRINTEAIREFLETKNSPLVNEIEQIIYNAAIRHKIDKNKFLETAKCESSLNVNAIGDDGRSIGLFQIHLISHPEVTREQALDPYWATEWSAIKFKENPNIWVCYQKIYGQKRIK